MTVSFNVRESTQKALLARMQSLGIEESDLLETFVRASGPGGQHVNKTSTAVRLVHRLTGAEVKASAARSQLHNRFLARRLLCDEVSRLRGIQTPQDKKLAKQKKQKARRRRRAKRTSE